jgi:P-type Cu+ transporter
MNPDTTESAIDPVCGMTVDVATARGGSLEYDGTTYYFCSSGCREKFQKEPARYAKLAHSKAARASTSHPESKTPPPSTTPAPGTAAEWTCPMHPQVVRSGPGSCPICGMALEPRTVSAEELENHELKDMTRRFWVSVALTAPIVVLAMSELFTGNGTSWVAHSHAC